MKVSDSIAATARGRKAAFLLLPLFALLIGATSDALAIDCVADAGGIIDGFVNYPVPPPRINVEKIDERNPAPLLATNRGPQ